MPYSVVTTVAPGTVPGTPTGSQPMAVEYDFSNPRYRIRPGSVVKDPATGEDVVVQPDGTLEKKKDWTTNAIAGFGGFIVAVLGFSMLSKPSKKEG